MPDKQQTILVVDDDPNIAKLIRFYLKNQNYLIENAPDSRQGIQMARKNQYDLLLLDMQMPHIDGMTFLKTMADIPSFDTLIIVITAHDPDDEMRTLIEKHAYDFIQKPFTANRLRFTIRNALRYAAIQKKYTEMINSVIKA
jgi:DNA-binding response OmpR family regulator